MMNINRAINKSIEEFENLNPNIDGTGDNSGQREYLGIMKNSYFITLRDCIKYLPENNSNVCELGSFLGIVSKAFRYLGHNVTACDIPSFFEREEIKNYFKRSSIKCLAFNLRDNHIPLNSSSQDMVLACEILEHLNFNPLPIIKETNRVLKKGGYLYLATPNGNSLVKKFLYLLFNKHPSFTINQFYEQLDSSRNMIVGLHWREYNFNEIEEMILPFGFELVFKRFSANVGVEHGGRLKNFIKRLLFLFPGCKPNQILMFKKIRDSNMNLDINKDS